MKQSPREEELQEARELNCLVEDLPEARRKLTFNRYWQITHQDPDKENTKLNYLIYKHENSL